MRPQGDRCSRWPRGPRFHAARTRPCLVTDYEMPGIDGVALCQMVRGWPAFAGLPIVLLSAAGA
ncbi:response regulator [Paraburkholderia guartelaensis]|uniref:Response regulator n=1 Tax=Paraburkholderia guartelaensis TaxID=2546446 RepID=A0A4R5L409_9BURK|nr:response regulator [Paraburkholderia guartelaensis]